jgi:hypothetical protein
LKTLRLTKTYVDTLQPPPVPANAKKSQAFYRDTAIPGFALRVTSADVKTFIVEKRINGKNKRISLGRYGHLTVEQARK